MKRSPLPPRKTPIKRTGKVRPKRAKPRRSSRVRCPEYMEIVRTMRCCVVHGTPCGGRVTASHVGERGLGQKCSDFETVPMCVHHHLVELAGNRGSFDGFSKEERRKYAADAIAETQAAIFMFQPGLEHQARRMTIDEVVHVVAVDLQEEIGRIETQQVMGELRAWLARRLSK